MVELYLVRASVDLMLHHLRSNVPDLNVRNSYGGAAVLSDGLIKDISNGSTGHPC
jgi:hypothetical protein